MAKVEDVRRALAGVNDPELGRSLVELGMVKDVSLNGSTASIIVALTTPACPLKDRISSDVRAAVLALPGISEVKVEMVAVTAAERAKISGRPVDEESGEPLAKQFNQVDKVIAVMSGKGGVGKSLVTGLLAIALSRSGKKVGILDADITGPSIPKMFGVHGKPGMSPFGIVPRQSSLGISVMSINLLLERDDDAVIWRGPMIASVIKQFWGEVVWGKLDYLLVDLPPGTADAPLTVMQSLPLSGVIIVSSPQDLASMVVRKAVQMANQLKISVLGLVENMSYFVAPDTGVSYEVFGPSRAEAMAQSIGAPLLGRLPIDPAISELCDAGRIEEYRSEAYDGLAREFTGLALGEADLSASR